MVVKDDGTKWACQSCLKGHRVSGCTHTDRELFFVPKKGRPVTQCPHCRAERKKRSSHVKCDCGDKSHSKEKCIHLREAEAKAAAADAGLAMPPSSASGEHHSPDLYPVAEESPSSDEHHCCCPHGGKCICSTIKEEEAKEPIKVEPPKKETCKKSTVPTKSLSQRKPRLTSHQSEGHLTVFANGHHKPCHRNNNAAHESGVPYKLPRPHTTQPLSTKTNARRSIDSLASVAASQPQNWLQLTMPAQVSNSDSGQASPASAIAMQQDSTQPADSASQYPISNVSSSVPTSMFADFGFPSTSSIGTSTTDTSVPSFPLPSSDLNMNSDFWNNFDWSKVDTTSFDAQPALSNTSSGTLSEVDEIPATEDTTTFDNMPYSMDMQGISASNSTTNFDLDFSAASDQSNRWSMPIYADQNTSGVDLASMTADSFTKSKQSPEQAMSFSGFDMASSVQSQSPAQSAFQWDQAVVDYAMANTDNNNAMAYSVPASSGPSMAPTAAPSPKFGGDDATVNDQFFDFDNGSKLVNWSDSIMVPAGQDFLNTYNYDQNFSTSDFNSQGWSS